MKLPILFITMIGLLSLSACQPKANTDQGNMGQFADDTAFQAAHDKPEELAFTGKGEMITFATPDGKQGSAYALKPAQPSGKVLFVIHEWWGLNDHIKQEAEHLFDSLQNVTVMALDMYDGKSTDNPEEAGKLMQAVSNDRAEAIIKGALTQVGSTAQIATIGWCFGGGWSLRSAILGGKQVVGTVMYYGLPVDNAKELAPLKAPVLGIFAAKDAWITPEVVTKFENLAKATGKSLEVHQFPADHAFANPSNPNFDAKNAGEANKLALTFLRKHFGA
ncbi:MAG: dienelactone hydrolase family protein [Lewinellaceae bacterium]|nr:dienelactone hydrolase family protein [Lewinellaceae bacterium]